MEAGSYLFHAGEPSDSLYVVRSGRLQVLQNDVVLRELGRGEVIGELGFLIDAPRSASIRAMRDSTLVRLTKAGTPMRMRTKNHRITFDPYAHVSGRATAIMTYDEATQVLARVEREGA